MFVKRKDIRSKEWVPEPPPIWFSSLVLVFIFSMTVWMAYIVISAVITKYL